MPDPVVERRLVAAEHVLDRVFEIRVPVHDTDLAIKHVKAPFPRLSRGKGAFTRDEDQPLAAMSARTAAIVRTGTPVPPLPV
ncbi:hypothetical protein GCM10027598_55630 [Amycolatopsis oliviviridis]